MSGKSFEAILSSASRTKIHGLVAWASDALRASANESFHRILNDLTPRAWMHSRVASVEPVSTIMTSLTMDLTLWTAPSTQSSSFLTIMHSEIPTVALVRQPWNQITGYFENLLKSPSRILDTRLEWAMVGHLTRTEDVKRRQRMVGNKQITEEKSNEFFG